jgi:hypothetical protein
VNYEVVAAVFGVPVTSVYLPPGKGALMTIRVRRWLGMGLTAAALSVGCPCFAPGVTASASQKPLSCKLVPPAEIKATLGLSVSKPTAEQLMLGLGLNCTYTIGNTAGTLSVTINFRRPVTTQKFKSSIGLGGTTTAVHRLGKMAYSNVLGSGKYATITLYVLQDTTEFSVEVSAVPLAKVEALAREILPEV